MHILNIQPVTKETVKTIPHNADLGVWDYCHEHAKWRFINRYYRDGELHCQKRSNPIEALLSAAMESGEDIMDFQYFCIVDDPTADFEIPEAKPSIEEQLDTLKRENEALRTQLKVVSEELEEVSIQQLKEPRHA